MRKLYLFAGCEIGCGGVGQEMQRINEYEMFGAEYVCSRKYKEKLQKILQSEKYHGKRMTLNYVMRYEAVFALVVLCSYTAKTAIARVLPVLNGT
jgi:hypothetical protein